jgi:hypothetical protein
MFFVKLILVCSSSYRNIATSFSCTGPLDLSLSRSREGLLHIPLAPRPSRREPHHASTQDKGTTQTLRRYRLPMTASACAVALGPRRGGDARTARALFSGALLSPTNRHSVRSHRTRREDPARAPPDSQPHRYRAESHATRRDRH